MVYVEWVSGVFRVSLRAPPGTGSGHVRPDLDRSLLEPKTASLIPVASLAGRRHQLRDNAMADASCWTAVEYAEG